MESDAEPKFTPEQVQALMKLAAMAPTLTEMAKEREHWKWAKKVIRTFAFYLAATITGVWALWDAIAKMIRSAFGAHQ